jgi:hypothetical protein
MTTATADNDKPARRFLLLKLAAAYLIGLKLWFSWASGPLTDEAYYWLWGWRPELSYFDHPPFHAWLLGLVHAAFGTSLFSLRLLNLVVCAGTIWLIAAFCRQLQRQDWQSLFWPTLVLFLASPLYGVFNSIALHDYLLVFLCLLAGYFFLRFFVVVDGGGRGASADLFIGALALGLAGLTKYNALFLGLAVVVLVLSTRSLRRLLADWRLWAAGLLAVALQMPVLIWNFGEHFASFEFHLQERHGAAFFRDVRPGLLRIFVFETLGFLSPILIVPMARFFFARIELPFERLGRRLALGAFVFSTLTFATIALFDWVYWWWNTVAFILAMPFLARYSGRIVYGIHVLFGLVFSTYWVVSFTVFPLPLLSRGGAPDIVNTYQWDKVAEAVAAAELRYQPDFLATDRAGYMAALAFALDARPPHDGAIHSQNITAIASPPSQFDYWFDPADHRGDSAVVLAEPRMIEEYVGRHFQTITQIDSVDVVVMGRRLKTYTIYYATGYDGTK